MASSRRSFITSSTTGFLASAFAYPQIATANQVASPANPTQSAGNPELRAAIEKHGIPGALVLVDSPETGLWTAALGVANLDTGAPMTTDMHMRIGSITKTFTATMVLQLVDQGALALDDTLAALNPDLGYLPNTDTITVRHLLTMQSGLADYVTTAPVIEASRRPSPDRVYTPHELLGYIADKPAVFAPGEQGMYSNTNYLILSMIAEHLTGTPWRELIRTGILDEVGLVNTSLPEGPELPAPSARGYAYMPQPPTSEATPAVAIPGAATPASPGGPVDVTRINPSISNAAVMPDNETTVITMANVVPTRDGRDPALVLQNAISGT